MYCNTLGREKAWSRGYRKYTRTETGDRALAVAATTSATRYYKIAYCFPLCARLSTCVSQRCNCILLPVLAALIVYCILLMLHHCGLHSVAARLMLRETVVQCGNNVPMLRDTMKCIILCRYGHCSEYIWENDICRGSFGTGIDYVYVKSALGNQSTISNFLNSLKKEVVGTFDNDHDKDCEKQVFKVFCHYYLPPCGNITHPAPPSSICQEECQMVQDKCQETWNAALKTTDLVIDCSDTSKLLFPVPHCCTGAGLGMYTPFHSFP